MPARRDLLVLGGITLVAAAVRFATLDLQSYHHDEAVTASRVLGPNLFDTLSYVASRERSPPLYYLIAWPWAQAFGVGEVGLRSLSALIGTLTVPAAFFAGRELAGRAGASVSRRALLFAAFVALNPYLVWYSQEARSYAGMVLLSTVALGLFARSAREPSHGALGGWALASAGALLSHYFAIFLILGQGVWLLWKRTAERRQVLVAVGAIALVAVALLPLAREQQGEGRRDVFTDTSLAARVGEVPLNYVASEEPDPLAGSSRVDVIQAGAAAAGGIIFLLALGLLATRGAPEDRDAAQLAGVSLIAGLLVPLALAVIGFDFFNPRNLIAAVIPSMAIAAIGLTVPRAGWLGAAGVVATLALFATVLTAVRASAEMQREDWRGAAEAMGESSDDRLIVTNRNGDDPLLHYLGAEEFRGEEFHDGAEVEEVLALSTNYIVRPPRGFEEAGGERLAPTFVLTRFESEEPRLLTPEVLRKEVLTERSAVLLDPATP